MATELTWTADVNRAVASAASAAVQSKWELWYLLASLVGNTGLGFASNAGNWTVVRTCGSTDGTSGNLTADTTDRLHLTGSGAFTANDWVFGANTSGGTGRSWALIQAPSTIGSIYMLVDFGNATNGKCDITFGQTLSGNGSTTTAPTFSDGWSYAGAQFDNNSIAATHRVNLHLSTRGDFWWYPVFDTNAVAYAILGCTKLANAHAADLYPTVSLFAGAAAVNTATGFISGLTSTACLNGSTNATAKGRNFSGSASNALLGIAPAISSAGSASLTLTASANTGTNASDTTYNGFPIWLLDFTTTELKGRIPDLLWASGNPAQGSTVPNTTPFDYVKWGHCWAPWVSTSAPLI